MSPITRIPPEIISMIFDISRHLRRKRGCTEASILIRLRQVCRSWNNIIMNSPLLWKSIPTHSLQSLNKTLSLSRGVAGLNMMVQRNAPSDALAGAINNIERIRKLVVSRNPSDVSALLNAIRGRNTSVLEELLLEINANNNPGSGANTTGSDVAAVGSDVQLGSDHFVGAKLYRLGLRGVNCIAMTSHLVNPMHLKHLALEHLSSRAALTWQETRSLLESLPGLRSLNLTRAFKEESITPSSQFEEKVRMPCLKSLTVFTDQVRQLEGFFSLVEYPQTESLQIGALHSTFGGVQVNEDYGHILRDIFAACTDGHPSEGANVLVVDSRRQHPGMGLAADLAPKRCAIRVHGGERKFTIDVDLPSYTGQSDLEEAMRDVISQLKLYRLTRLVQGSDMSENLLKAHFESLPRLKFISLQGNDMTRAFIAVINSDREDVFPALEQVEFRSPVYRLPTRADKRNVAELRRKLNAFQNKRNSQLTTAQPGGNRFKPLRFSNFKKDKSNKLFPEED